MTSPVAPRRNLSWITAAITACCLAALQLGGSAVVSALRYDRMALADGEWWRWLTASLVHAGWSHLAVNLAALAIVWLTLGAALTVSRWTLGIAVSALAVTLGLWLWSPEVDWYLGASGAVHGLFAAGATTPALRREPTGLVIMALLAAKLAWEQLAGPLPGSEAAVQVPVIVDAHLYGTLGGLVSAALAALPVPRGPGFVAKGPDND